MHIFILVAVKNEQTEENRSPEKHQEFNLFSLFSPKNSFLCKFYYFHLTFNTLQLVLSQIFKKKLFLLHCIDDYTFYPNLYQLPMNQLPPPTLQNFLFYFWQNKSKYSDKIFHMPTLNWDQKEKPVGVPVKAPLPRQVWLSSHKITFGAMENMRIKLSLCHKLKFSHPYIFVQPNSV